MQFITRSIKANLIHSTTKLDEKMNAKILPSNSCYLLVQCSASEDPTDISCQNYQRKC